jgi:protocatechuate 3,4-dioxygenase beta subunit
VIEAFPPVPPGTWPPNDYPDYRSSARRAPRAAAIAIPQTVSELSGPGVEAARAPAAQLDLTRHDGQEAIGQRIIVCGRVADQHGRPERNAVIEVWQANAAGRYRHDGDRHDAPLDPGFAGGGMLMTDDTGAYAFVTIEPGVYPWGNHYNAWRPRHIHFSLFGAAWAARLVTQMYFPGDPLLDSDPIFRSTPDPAARARLVAAFDPARTAPDHALAFRFDIVLRGPAGTPFEAA